MTQKKERMAPLADLMEHIGFVRVHNFLVARLKSKRLAYLYALLRNKRDFLYVKKESIRTADAWFYYTTNELQEHIPEKNTESILRGQVDELVATGLIESRYDKSIHENKHYRINDEVFKRMYEEYNDKKGIDAEKFEAESGASIPLGVIFRMKATDGSTKEIKITINNRKIVVSTMNDRPPIKRKYFKFEQLTKNNELHLLWDEGMIDYLEAGSNEGGAQNDFSAEYLYKRTSRRYSPDESNLFILIELLKPVFNIANVRLKN